MEYSGQAMDQSTLESSVSISEISQVPTLAGASPAWTPEAEDITREFTILLADGNLTSRFLLRSILGAPNHRILECTRAAEALAALEQEKVDLIIVDLVLPGMGGPDFCRRVRCDRRHQLVPVIMITSAQGVENEIQGINSGADEFLTRPLSASVVRARVRAMLRHKAAIDTLEEAETILFALAQAIEQRDRYTGGHCERLAAYSVALARAIGLPSADQLALHRGGYLHDIGKVAIPDAILFKRGPLTSEEWRVMQTHTLRGEEICKHMKTLAPVLPIIRHHHERWDGSGYPDGLKGDRIPLLARILQLVDIYDALTTARPYKPACSPAEAMDLLEEEARRGWRDPELVAVFREISSGLLAPASAPIAGSLESMQRALTETP